MKTKRTTIIGFAISLFIFFNLSIALSFDSESKDSGLISVIQKAYAGGEDHYMCDDPNNTGWDAEWRSCPPGCNHDYYYACIPVCYTSSCDVSGQFDC